MIVAMDHRTMATAKSSNTTAQVLEGSVKCGDRVMLPIVFDQQERSEAEAVLLLESAEFLTTFGCRRSPYEGDQRGAPCRVGEIPTVLNCVAA